MNIYSSIKRVFGKLFLNSELFSTVSNPILQKKLEKFHRIFLSVYAILILAIVTLFFSDIISWCKTVGNLYNLDVIANRYRVLFCVGFVFLTLYLFFKSLYSIIFAFVFHKNSINCSLTNKISLLITTITILFVINLGQYSITKYTNQISEDLRIVKTITNDLTQNNIPFRLYVHKVPLVFSKNGLNVENKILGFNDLVFNFTPDKRPNLVITKAKDEYQLFFQNGYQYVKLSDNTGMYTNIPKVLENAPKYNLKFTKSFTYEKTLDLNYIAKVNRLKFKNNALVLTPKKKIDKVQCLQFNPGKYKISFNFNSIELLQKDLPKESDIGKMTVYANGKAITLGEQNIKLSDFKAENTPNKEPNQINGNKRYEIELNLNKSYRNVTLTVNLFIDAMLTLDEIKISKVQ